jgi:hypothetical protein
MDNYSVSFHHCRFVSCKAHLLHRNFDNFLSDCHGLQESSPCLRLPDEKPCDADSVAATPITMLTVLINYISIKLAISSMFNAP